MAHQEMPGSLSRSWKHSWLYVAVICVTAFTATEGVRGAAKSEEENVAFWISRLDPGNSASVRAFAAAMLGRIANAKADQSKLIETLEMDQDVHVRANAAAALGSIGGDLLLRSVDALVTALQDDDGELRTTSAMALAEVEPNVPVDHLDELIAALGDETVQVSIHSATALAKIGAPAIDGLFVALASSDQRAGAASALSQIVDDIPLEHLPALITGLSDDDARVRTGCSKALGKMGAPALDDLVKVLASGNQNAKIAAATVLTDLARIDAALLIPHVIVLTEALDDESILVRAPCTIILGEIGTPAEEQLTITLGSGTGRARAGAAVALAAIVPSVSEKYVPNLVDGLGDNQRRVRNACRQALANVGAIAALDLIKALEPTSDAKNRLEVLNSLFEVSPGAPAIITVLLEALKDNDMDVRLRAVEIIRDVGSNSNIATAAIVDRFQNDQEVPVQLAAIDALVVMAPANDSTPQLIKTLAQGLTTDPDWVVRALAAEALGNVGPAASAVSASLVKASKDPDVCVRTNALRALRLISP